MYNNVCISKMYVFFFLIIFSNVLKSSLFELMERRRINKKIFGSHHGYLIKII